MLVGIYTRVSTQEQSEHGYSLTEQEERLKSYCGAMDWKVFRVYTDGGFSGGSMDRPALRQMIQDIETHRIQKVVVWKLDRLSRSQLDTLYLIEKIFLVNNCDFVSMSENFDTATPLGKAMVGILAVFAQLEREQIKERMMIGHSARAKSGRWQGGGLAPIGYDYRDGELVINPYEAMQVQEAFNSFLSGVPVTQIERKFWESGYTHKYGRWSGKAIHGILENPIYTGQITFQKQAYPGTHEPIIEPEIFAKAQARIATLRHSRAQSESVKYLLSGLVFCARCGARYGPHTKTTKTAVYRYYTCYSRHKISQKMVRDPNCKNKAWRADDLDQLVCGEICKLRLDSGQIDIPKTAPKDNPITALEQEVQKIDTQISRLIDLYTVGKIDLEQIAKRSEELSRRKTAIEKQINELRSRSDIQPEQAAELILTFADLLRKGNQQEIRATIVSLIDKIDIDGEDVTIHWRFS